jgi:hypothetical protein
VGVVASFRRQDQGVWKIIKAVDPEDKSIMSLELNGASLTMIPDKKAKSWDPVEAVDSFSGSPVQRAPATSITVTDEPGTASDPGDNYDDAEYPVY